MPSMPMSIGANTHAGLHESLLFLSTMTEPSAQEILQALLAGVSDEIFLFTVGDFQLVGVSQSVLNNVSGDLEAIRLMRLDDLLGVSQQTLHVHISCHRHHGGFTELIQDQPPLIGNHSYDQLWVKVLFLAGQEHVLILRNDVSGKREAMQALSESESRFQAIVSNTPGLVFQFQLDAQGMIQFVYLSEGCKALLGMDAEALKLDPHLFYDMVNGKDRTSLKRRLKLSMLELSLLNWEGRVWIDDWQDTKWINLRSIPRVLNNGVIQWEGIMTNITQSKNEKHEIEESRKRLAELSAHLNHVKEKERGRIAREIHDDLGGNLTAIKIGLSSLINRLKAGQPVSVEQAVNLESIVDNTFEAAHRISSDLRPTTLELGVVAALEWQAKEFEKQMNIPCQFVSSQPEIALTNDQAITLFRICQEAMSNIAKYAQAFHVRVNLEAMENEIRLRIEDDGVGIQPGDMLKKNSFGLRGMQERVDALGGRLHVGKHHECGTVIDVALPL